MTTLIDDGLVENCFDDPISLVDFDRFTIIDVDDIGATIEDPGDILDESLETCNKNEEYTSSYKKRASILPVTFFDISRNISLLKKCRPISINIVDCDIYPWYYRNIKHTNKNKDVISKTEDSYQYKSNYNITDAINSSYVKDSACSILPTSFSNINISPEQRPVVLELKEEIENQAHVNEVYKNITSEVNRKKVNSTSYEDFSPLKIDTPEQNFDKYAEHHDLLTYKAIAQTLVRNIDHKEVNTKCNNTTRCNRNPEKNKSNENEMSIEFENFDIHKIEQKKEREKLSSSPILPYSIKPKKKAKPKDTMFGKSSETNNILEKWSDSTKKCDKMMSSINQVIPHYHCKLPVSTNNNDNHFTNMGHNPIPFKGPIISDLSFQWHQTINRDLLMAQHAQASKSVGKIPHRDLSRGYKELSNDSHVNSLQITKEQHTGNTNKIFHMPSSNCQFDYSYQQPDQINISTNRFSRQDTIENGNSLPLVRRASAKEVSKENCRVFLQPSTISNNVFDTYNYIPNSAGSINKYVNYNTAQIPLQRYDSNMSNVVQRNPLLCQLLNYNDLSNCYQPTLEQPGGLDSRPFVRRNTYQSVESNYWPPIPPPLPHNYQYYLPSLQYTQGKQFQNPNNNTSMQNFSNTHNTNLLQHKTYSNLKHKKINSSELTKHSNNVKNNLINAQIVTNSVTPETDSMKQNFSSYSGFKNKSHISSKAHEIIDQKVLLNKVAENKKYNYVYVPTEPTKSKDVNMSNKHIINSMIKVLNNKKSSCLYSELHKCKSNTQSIKKNTGKSLKQHVTPNSYKSDTKFKTNKGLTQENITLKPPKDVNVAKSQQVEFKVNGYSPPILPIPSFKKSLEILSDLQRTAALNSTKNENTEITPHRSSNMSEERKNKQQFTNTTRKRKLSDDEGHVSSRRISLQEYKLRRTESVITTM